MRYNGIVFGIGLSPKFKINSNLSILGFIVLNESFFEYSESYLVFQDNNKGVGLINLLIEKLRFDDEPSVTSGFAPNVKPIGIVFNIGIYYRFGRKG